MTCPRSHPLLRGAGVAAQVHSVADAGYGARARSGGRTHAPGARACGRESHGDDAPRVDADAGNDGLIWPHCDGFNWPHFVGSSADDAALIERGSEAGRKWVPEWLLADLDEPRKQRHTAKRIWRRLVDEHGAAVAETTVRDYWWRIYQFNVLGVHLCCRAVIPTMLARGRGRVAITVSAAAYLPGGHRTAYPPSKAAVCRYGEALANELAGRIPIFMFSPGLACGPK